MNDQQQEQFEKYKEMSIAALEKLTEQENPDSVAFFALAEKYVDQDREQKEIVPLYLKAANKGLADVQNTLGCIYESGYGGVEQDYEQVAAWYRKAANQGFAEAQFNLGHCYERGYGVAKNKGRAVAWYKKAARQKYMYALCYLGGMYERGLEEGKQNQEKACALFMLAGMNGLTAGIDNPAGDIRRDLENDLKLSELTAKFKKASAKLGMPLEKYLEDVAGLTPKKAGAAPQTAATAGHPAASCG